MNDLKNIATNVAGAIGAAAIAAGPIIDSQSGSMTGNDWGKLIAAVAIAVLGWFSGKDAKGKKKVMVK